MIVRCGRCRAQFDVPGPGQYACPQCGTANQVGGPAEPPGIVTPPSPTPQPEKPSPRVTCPDCGFEFIVGVVDVAPCPMCGSEVPTGLASEAEAPRESEES